MMSLILNEITIFKINETNTILVFEKSISTMVVSVGDMEVVLLDGGRAGSRHNNVVGGADRGVAHRKTGSHQVRVW